MKALAYALLATTLISGAAMATPGEFTHVDQLGMREGFAQDTPKEPPMLKNMKLTDPLMQRKYLNDPEMLRFVRGAYTEACARGLVVEATQSIRADQRKMFSAEQRQAANELLESNRLWRMGSYELEAFVGNGYINAANYCDCMIKELTPQELVNPDKALDSIKGISSKVQKACETTAADQTLDQIEARKAAVAESKKGK